MFHYQLKAAFDSAIDRVSSRISSFVKRPGRDMSRKRKLSAATLMSYLVSQGSSSTCCEKTFCGQNISAIALLKQLHR